MSLLDRVFVQPRVMPQAGAVAAGGGAGAVDTSAATDPTVALPGAGGGGGGGGAQSAGAAGIELASTFVQQASRRLGLVSLLMAGGMVVGCGLSLLVVEATGWSDAPVLVLRACMVSLILLSVGVYLLSRSQEITPGLLLKIGLVYEVVGAMGLSLPAVFTHGPPDNLIHIPWLCVWIVLFPLVVPVAPLKSFITSAIAALTFPLAFAIYVAAGHPAPEAKQLVYGLAPPAVCVGLATAAASVIHGLGLSISQARRDLSRARSDLRSLGSYRLVEPLGRGGMGEVWRAEHAMLARPAAIKLIRADKLVSATSSERGFALGRFEREARVTAALGCPHTVDLYDYGITEDGSLYYVMELLDGADLDEIVREGALPPERVIHVLRQACLSLAEAHEAGLVHRDVKPANIYLCRLGLEHDFTKVLDFGLVKEGRRGPSTGEVDKLTADGTLLGTFAYMAPEQIDGAERVDGRADIYSLGAVAYRLLTRRHVFEGDTPGQVLFGHAQKKPVPPSERAEQRIPEALDRLVLDCLAKKPEDRPATARELGERLAACTVAEPWTQERAAAWWRVHRAASKADAQAGADAGGEGGGPVASSERPTVGY